MYAQLNMVQKYLPCTDHTEPTVEQLTEACAFIAEQRSHDHKVYIHCKGGHGRGGAAAFAWLLTAHGKSLKETQGEWEPRTGTRRTVLILY